VTPVGPSQPDKLQELLADRAMLGLSPSEEAELASLLRGSPSAGMVDMEAFELAAAAADLALAPPTQAMPAALRAKVGAAGRSWVQSQAALSNGVSATAGNTGRRDVIGRIEPLRSPSRPMVTTGGLGWLAAAACLTLAAASWYGQKPAGSSSDAAAAKAALVSTAPDLTRWDWQPMGEVAADKPKGEVVWSTTRQKGYMSFAGLRPNDPTREQYQLWIFDPSQSDKTPIDGGVFNVTSTGEVVVPIDPKLSPAGPVMFAITIEKPGGVVVSDRSRLILIAKPA
jgi:hypothetical protein